VTGQPERVVIVGGGVLGTMHAVMARRRGISVVQLEREPEARGASVRNFGLLWVSGRRAGPELALALRARELWEQIAADAPGTGFRPSGSLTLATDEAELRVLREAAALPDAKERDFELLDSGGVRAVNPALRGDFLGGLLCRADAVVEPRQALPALRASLAGPGYEWLPGIAAAEIVAHGVRDHTGRWHRGDLVIVCTGANFAGLADHNGGSGLGLRRVRLQMLQTEPFPERLTTAVADGDSLRYYPAYDVPGRTLLAPQSPVAAAARAQLLLVQRADGGLTIGDTHAYDEPFAFDLDEDAYDHLRARARALLGAALPRTRRRWAGVYSEVADDGAGGGAGGGAAGGQTSLYHRSRLAPGVVLVTGPGGRGMTCSPAIAEETFRCARLLSPAWTWRAPRCATTAPSSRRSAPPSPSATCRPAPTTRR
jgi:FAD dependent oxidoreductase TIGR03364